MTNNLAYCNLTSLTFQRCEHVIIHNYLLYTAQRHIFIKTKFGYSFSFFIFIFCCDIIIFMLRCCIVIISNTNVVLRINSFFFMRLLSIYGINRKFFFYSGRRIILQEFCKHVKEKSYRFAVLLFYVLGFPDQLTVICSVKIYIFR